MQAVNNSFSIDTQAAIACLCRELTRRTQRTVIPEYGTTDDGAWSDAALCIERLPAGSPGLPGPLVSILVGPNGFDVMGANGAPLAQSVDLPEATKVARFGAMRQYRRMTSRAAPCE